MCICIKLLSFKSHLPVFFWRLEIKYVIWYIF